jgi:hypothetical protein
MQLDKLISNINLVLRENILVFAKLTIPGQKSGFSENHWRHLYPLIRYGAMANDKSHVGE